MKVVYADGREGELNQEDSRNLNLVKRHSREDWEELKNEMDRLGIIKYEDAFMVELGIDMISIDFIKSQINFR